MKIAVFGSTLNAAVMGALFAERGHSVIWCPESDIRFFHVHNLPFDSNLKKIIELQQLNGALKICDLSQILKYEFDVYFLAFNPSKLDVAIELAHKLKAEPIIHPKLMVNSSTFGLQGTKTLQDILSKDAWVYIPDMTQEGSSVENIEQSTSIVIGTNEDAFAKKQIKELLRPIYPRMHQLIFMPILDAEFTKMSISGMLATRISYMNDLSLVAEKLNIDIENVRLGVGADSRIGPSYLYSGVGFGGENFSRDILALSQTVTDSGNRSRLLQQVWEINEQQKELLFRKFWNYYKADIQGKTVAIWGASFRESSSSIINSPIHSLLQAFWAQKVTVRLHDPRALPEIEKVYGARDDLILCDDQYEAAENAHALCLVTAWKQYWSPDYRRLKNVMQHPFILDGRNIYDPHYVKEEGFAYEGVGRL